jgi:hypothetical protein
LKTRNSEEKIKFFASKNQSISNAHVLVDASRFEDLLPLADLLASPNCDDPNAKPYKSQTCQAAQV